MYGGTAWGHACGVALLHSPCRSALAQQSYCVPRCRACNKWSVTRTCSQTQLQQRFHFGNLRAMSLQIAPARQELTHLGLTLVAYIYNEETETRAVLCRGKDRLVGQRV
jgi:hypothetical protein